MKTTVATLVAFFAAYAAAAAVHQQNGNTQHDAAAMAAAYNHVVARAGVQTNLKFDLASVHTNAKGNYQYTQTIHGDDDAVEQFIDTISYDRLRQVMGKSWGENFYFTFKNDDTGRKNGYLAGWFNSDGSISFDPDSQIPNGGEIPNVRKQPSKAPETVTVKATADQSKKIIEAGKITDDDLHDLLGDDYGKPFKIILTNPQGNQIGFGSGTITGDGAKFDPNTYIPKPDVTSTQALSTSTRSSAPAPTEAGGGSGDANKGSVTLDGSNADDIKQQLNNFPRDAVLKATGGKYGDFYINFTSKDGTLKGYIKGTITPNSYHYQWSYTYVRNNQ